MQDDGIEHLDVLVVGAGISGIGAAHALQTRLPGKRFAVLEARDRIGGTWDLFRYPGIRSDSDLTTFGYDFKPWTDRRVIAGADRIMTYLRETVDEHGIERHIRYRRRVTGAEWNGPTGRWTVDVEHTDTGERSRISCTWIFAAGGYFRYEQGYTPEIPGLDRFAGPVVHPQHWPEQLDTAGKRVVVIGSGATAVTLVPALAETAAHVTMLQRTPTYVLSMPSEDRLGERLRAVLGDRRAHTVLRGRSIATQRGLWLLSRRAPKLTRRLVRRHNIRRLPKGYPVDVHFNPPYGVWDQRLCIVPDGDLFRVIREGSASIVTARIRTVTEQGVELEDGRTLDADVLVTATGLVVEPFGSLALRVDGEPVRLADTVSYRGLMLSGVPNFAYSIGYTNASWTLKVGLLCEYFARLLAHMDEHGLDVCVPRLPEEPMATRPLLDFGAGYVQRALDRLPKQGVRAPWATSMSYAADVRVLRRGPVADEHLRFSRVPAQRPEEPVLR